MLVSRHLVQASVDGREGSAASCLTDSRTRRLQQVAGRAPQVPLAFSGALIWRAASI